MNNNKLISLTWLFDIVNVMITRLSSISIVWCDSRHHKWDTHMHNALKIRTALYNEFLVSVVSKQNKTKIRAAFCRFAIAGSVQAEKCQSYGISSIITQLVDVDSLCNTRFISVTANRFYLEATAIACSSRCWFERSAGWLTSRAWKVSVHYVGRVQLKIQTSEQLCKLQI